MNFRKYAGIILNILVPLLTVYLVCVWGLRLVVFFLPFVIGWIVAAIANPVVRFFEKRLKIVRRHGSMVLIAGVLALVIFGIYALFSWVFREMTEFGQALPGIYASIREEVDLACERIGGLLKYLPADTEMTIVSELENVGGYIGDFVQKIAASAGSRVVRTLPEVFVNTIIVFLSSYLFLADHDKLVETVRKVMPEPVIKYGRMMKSDIRTLIGGYFLAQFKIMFVVAVVHERENKCKELHKEMNMNVGPTRLVQPDFYLLVDVDDLQKQVNTLENEVHRMKRVEARRKWRYGRKNY